MAIQSATLIAETLRQPIFKIENFTAVIDLPYGAVDVIRKVGQDYCSFDFVKQYYSDIVSPFFLITDHGLVVNSVMRANIDYNMHEEHNNLAYQQSALMSKNLEHKIIRYQDMGTNEIIYPQSYMYDVRKDNPPPCDEKEIRFSTVIDSTSTESGTSDKYRTITVPSRPSGPVFLRDKLINAPAEEPTPSTSSASSSSYVPSSATQSGKMRILENRRVPPEQAEIYRQMLNNYRQIKQK